MGDGIAQGAIDATGIAAGPEGYAFALRRCRSRHPAPGGVAPSPTSRKRACRATRKRSSLSSRARKGKAVFSTVAPLTTQMLSEITLHDLGFEYE